MDPATALRFAQDRANAYFSMSDAANSVNVVIARSVSDEAISLF